MAAVNTEIHYGRLEHIVELYGKRGQNALVELTPAIAESMHSEILEVFEKEGAVAGNPEWPGFWWERQGLPKPKGRRWLGNPKLLQDTGNLVGSLTPSWDEHSVEVYTNVPYAIFHVSPEPREVIPLRDFFAFDHEAFEHDVADMLILRVLRPGEAA